MPARSAWAATTWRARMLALARPPRESAPQLGGLVGALGPGRQFVLGQNGSAEIANLATLYRRERRVCRRWTAIEGSRRIAAVLGHIDDEGGALYILAPLSKPVCVAAENVFRAAAWTMADGGIGVAWSELVRGPSALNARAIYARRVGPDGSLAPTRLLCASQTGFLDIALASDCEHLVLTRTVGRRVAQAVVPCDQAVSDVVLKLDWRSNNQNGGVTALVEHWRGSRWLLASQSDGWTFRRSNDSASAVHVARPQHLALLESGRLAWLDSGANGKLTLRCQPPIKNAVPPVPLANTDEIRQGPSPDSVLVVQRDAETPFRVLQHSWLNGDSGRWDSTMEKLPRRVHETQISDNVLVLHRGKTTASWLHVLAAHDPVTPARFRADILALLRHRDASVALVRANSSNLLVRRVAQLVKAASPEFVSAVAWSAGAPTLLGACVAAPRLFNAVHFRVPAFDGQFPLPQGPVQPAVLWTTVSNDARVSAPDAARIASVLSRGDFKERVCAGTHGFPLCKRLVRSRVEFADLMYEYACQPDAALDAASGWGDECGGSLSVLGSELAWFDSVRERNGIDLSAAAI